MLVSSIAHFNAINTMNSATSNMMNATSSFTNFSTFGGEHDLAMLHEKDKRLSLDLASNSLVYKMAYLQEKFAQKRQSLEVKRSFDVMV